MRRLAARWMRDYRAADADQRAEMIEHAESVYWGMDYSNGLIEGARNDVKLLDREYAVVGDRGKRGAYICRHPGTGAMYVTHWGGDDDMDDTSFLELGIDSPAEEEI